MENIICFIITILDQIFLINILIFWTENMLPIDPEQREGIVLLSYR
jgi:hypothetical protein